MRMESVRYTASLPLVYISELKEMVRDKRILSINSAINLAVEAYLKKYKDEEYEAQLRDAGKDESFLARTLNTADDFMFVDSEVSGTW